MITPLLTRLERLATSSRRSATVAERNVAALTAGSWISLLTGFCEPLIYLFAIGVGLGSVIGEISLPGGHTTSYAAFAAPAMLASYGMSSALAETTFVFFGRLRYLKVYDAILATPIRPMELALGELGWALVRVCIYAIGFLGVMTAMGFTTPLRAVAALPAVMLSALAFGCIGVVVATMVRGWQDLDAMHLIQFGLFMFSATFVPIDVYPAALRWLVQATPLYHAVVLNRAITTGSADWSQLLNVGYLLAVVIVGMLAATRRIGRLLRA